MKKTISIAALALFAFGLPGQKSYQFDKNHARLGFSISHFGVSNVEGTFRIKEAELKSAKDDFSDAVINMEADAASINTENEMRDKDLKGSGWFDVAKYPAILFKSTSFRKTGERNYKMDGNLTIHGVTRPMSFDVVYNGKVMNPMMKKNVVGFTVTGKINRTEFGVGTDAFAAVVGKEAEVRSNVEFIVENEGSAVK
jgi:polyisoprenoid-binding protein YceI